MLVKLTPPENRCHQMETNIRFFDYDLRIHLGIRVLTCNLLTICKIRKLFMTDKCPLLKCFNLLHVARQFFLSFDNIYCEHKEGKV